MAAPGIQASSRHRSIAAAVRRGLIVTAMAAAACSGSDGPTVEPGGPASGFPPSFVDCSVFGDPAASPSVLPFGVGQRFRVSRTFGHYYTPDGNIQAGGVQLYAIDVPMPIGTPVHAMRGGIVVAIEEGFADDDHGRVHENFVMVRHADRTVGRYIHLTRNGALVEVGAAVTQGERVGLSGNSGESTAPHLHVDVQSCGPNLPPGFNNLPCGQTIPLSFRNTERHSCGLEPGRSYTALPFTPDLP